jgi:PEGA domain
MNPMSQKKSQTLLFLLGSLAVLSVAILPGCGSAPQEMIRTDSQAGRVIFKVDPNKATVFIDGVERGLARDFDGTPAILELPEGVHMIELRHPEHETYRTKIYLSDTVETIRVKMRGRTQ